MILGSTLDMGVGPFLFFHTVNLVAQSLPLEYYTTKINSLPVILEIISLFKEQMVSHKRSTTFSNVENSCGIHACESLSKSAQSDSFPVSHQQYLGLFILPNPASSWNIKRIFFPLCKTFSSSTEVLIFLRSRFLLHWLSWGACCKALL